MAQEKLSIDFRGKSATMLILVAEFVDNGHFVAFSPSLNLSAYGSSKQEAAKMLFEDVVTDYFDNLFKLNEAEISAELATHGWKRGKFIRKRFTNSPHVDSKGILQNFNLPMETKVTHHMMDEEITTAA